MSDIFDQVADMQHSPEPMQAAQPVQAAQSGGDVFDQVSQSAPSQQSQPKQDTFDQVDPNTVPSVSDPNEGTLGKVWNFASQPLLNLHREGAGPIESGVENFASGLTSPLSIGLMVLTGGLGSLAEGAGAEALTSFAPELANAIKPAAAFASKAMNLGFTGTQIVDVAKNVPQIRDAIQSGDTDHAIELLTETALGAGAAGLSAAHLTSEMRSKPFDFNGSKQAIGEYQSKVERGNLDARNFELANKDLIRNKPQDAAALMYHEAAGDTAKLEQWRQDILSDASISDRVKGKYDSVLKLAQNLPDNVKDLSDKLRTDYAEDWQRGQQSGIFDPLVPEGRDNYAGQHKYVPDDESDSSIRPSTTGKKTPDFAKARKFDTLFDAIKAGFEPADQGLASARSNYIRQLAVSEGLRSAETKLQEVAAPDGSPIGVNPAKVRIVNDVPAIALPQGADIAKLDDSARLFEFNGKKYIDVGDYKQGPDKFNMYRVKQSLFDEEGEPVPVFERQNLLVHPDYVQPVKQAFQDESWFRKNAFSNAILRASTQAKKSLLSLSPFHLLTEGERGLQMGLSPLEVIKPPQIDPDGLAMSKGTKHGLTLLGDAPGRNQFAEGVGSNAALLHKIPVLGEVLHAAEDKLFSDYIPRLKALTFERLSDTLSKKNPDWSDAQVYATAAHLSNSAYGGLNWTMLGKSLTGQDFLRLTMLAPDFTGSQYYFAKAGFEPGGSQVWQSFARIAAYNALVAQTLNLLNTGKVHMDHPFSVVSDDGKKIYSVRTMPEDLAHALTDPRGFAYNRLNPITTKPAIEFLTGKDQQGRNASYGQQVSDLLRNVIPMPVQSIGASDPGGQFMRSFGVGRTQNRTAAEELAIQKSSARGSQGAIPQEQLAQHQELHNLTDQLREKQITSQQVVQQLRSGAISRQQAERVFKESQLSPLAARIQNLPLADSLDVYDIATTQEKAALRQMLLKKVETFYKSQASRTPQANAYLAQRVRKSLGLHLDIPSHRYDAATKSIQQVQ